MEIDKKNLEYVFSSDIIGWMFESKFLLVFGVMETNLCDLKEF